MWNEFGAWLAVSAFVVVGFCVRCVFSGRWLVPGFVRSVRVVAVPPFVSSSRFARFARPSLRALFAARCRVVFGPFRVLRV